MRIRNAVKSDLDRIMDIYAYARTFMAEHGNPTQWGTSNWPPRNLIEEDIQREKSYVCVNNNDEVIGVFFYDYGKDIDPTYGDITDGNWFDESPYAVVHRLAADGSQKGIGTFCLNWAFEKSGHVRIDTHGDNKVMQNLLTKLGFKHTGTVYVESDDMPRIAFEKTRERK